MLEDREALREVAAIVAMHALIRLPGWAPPPHANDALAETAVRLADALLAELEKKSS
jgi:hypothetical protein